MLNHTLFISDLHLHADVPEITERFQQFWQSYAPTADAVYLLGDIFEVWVGDDDKTPFHTEIKQLLLKQTQGGKPVYVMRGNRDFLLDKAFMQETGCSLLEDPSLVQLYGHLVLLTHGDLLCLRDKKHQLFRKWSQYRLIKRIFLSLPLTWRQAIANKIRQASKNHTQQTAEYIMDVSSEEVVRWMERHNVQLLIHGHTHRPAFHPISLKNNAKGVRIVLGDWHQRGHALRFYANGSYEFLEF